MMRTISVALLLAGPLLASGGASADVVLDWNATTLNTIAAQNPFAQARLAAITQLAVFEAVNAITGDYETYLGTLNAPAGASPEAAAIAAAHDVLVNYFPLAAASLDATRDATLATIPDGLAKTDGVAVGHAAALAMIASRANDGSGLPQFFTPSSFGAGDWQPTPGCPPAGGILLHWKDVAPFGILSSSQFRSGPPPVLHGGRYARDYNEVKEVGESNSALRPQDRADVARYFAVVSAAHAWNQAARQASAARGTSLSENARILALLNMALSDGLVSSMETKYHYVFWRPYTAIRSGDTDANANTEANPDWNTFIGTPCFPSYPSAHASASYAARKIAEQLIGGGNHSITLSHPAVPGVTLHYTHFSQITDDIDDARVFGGIHFRFDQQAGARQGRQVGQYVCQSNLRPTSGDDDCEE